MAAGSKLSIGSEILLGSIAMKAFTINSPYGRHRLGLSAIRRIRAVRPRELRWMAKAPKPRNLEVVIDMKNLTRLRGAVNSKTLDFSTLYGQLAIPVRDITEIRMSNRPGRPGVSVRCRNLDEILVQTTPKTMFPLKTSYGAIKVPLEQVASIAISGGLLDLGLACYWSFDNKDAVDRISGAKGTISKTVTFDKGIVGLAPVFRNYTTKILIPSPRLNYNGWKQITISAWVKFNSYSTYGIIHSRHNPERPCGPWLAAGGAQGGEWVGGSFGVRLTGGKYEMIRPASLKPGIRPYPKQKVWHHLVGVYDGRRMRVYVNGKLDGQKKVATPGLTIFDSPGAITVIGRSSAPNRETWRDTYFPGPVDEIKIWRRALNSAEIEKLYEETLAESRKTTPK